LSRYCAAAQLLYFSFMPMPFEYPPSGPYDSIKVLKFSFPPFFIFLSWSSDHLSIVIERTNEM